MSKPHQLVSSASRVIPPWVWLSVLPCLRSIGRRPQSTADQAVCVCAALLGRRAFSPE